MSKNKDELLKIISVNTLPKNIEKYVDGSEIYNKTFSNRSNIFNIKDKGIYMKVSLIDNLREEYENTLYFHKKGVAGEVVDFIQDNNRDYLLVKEIPGENGISKEHLKNPKKLAESFGKYLRMIHSLTIDQCPNIDRTKLLLWQCTINVREDKFDMDDFFKNYGFTPNQGLLMLGSLSDNYVNDVFLHGDYCLPNIIMNNYEFSGIIDMDFSGIGDRHYDICSGINSLNRNLNTREYEDIFLDAYGRDAIDKDRLAFAKLLLILS